MNAAIVFRINHGTKIDKTVDDVPGVGSHMTVHLT